MVQLFSQLAKFTITYTRVLSFSLEKKWAPRALRFSLARLALWRTGLYSIVTFLRL